MPTVMAHGDDAHSLNIRCTIIDAVGESLQQVTANAWSSLFKSLWSCQDGVNCGRHFREKFKAKFGTCLCVVFRNVYDFLACQFVIAEIHWPSICRASRITSS